jgi:hypothetical protein
VERRLAEGGEVETYCSAAKRRLAEWLSDEHGAATLLAIATRAPLQNRVVELVMALAERLGEVLHLDGTCRVCLALVTRSEEWPPKAREALVAAFVANLRRLAASRLGCQVLKACLESKKGKGLAVAETLAGAVAADADELSRHWEGCLLLEAAVAAGHGTVARCVVRSKACVRALGSEERWAPLLAEAAGAGFPGNWRDYADVVRSLPSDVQLCRTAKAAALAAM